MKENNPMLKAALRGERLWQKLHAERNIERAIARLRDHLEKKRMEKQIPTKQRLAAAIREVSPDLEPLALKAEQGFYDDFESPLANPIMRLVADLQAVGAHDLILRAINGEFDGTKEESAAWFEREGKHLDIPDELKKLFEG